MLSQFVVDTNVLISAALRPSGVPRAVVDTIRHENGISGDRDLLAMSPFHGIPSLTPADALRR